jgi:methyl-accepting chemotaxis protein
MDKIISKRPTSFPLNLRARLADLRTKPKILIGICTPLAMLLILGAVSVSTTMSVVDNNKWVDHTNRVLGKAAAIVGSAVDMETGMRGYLLAGKEDCLAPYTAGGKKAFEDIAGLKDTVSDNPKQVARLGEAEKTLKEWQSQIADTTIEMRRQIGDAKTMNDMARLIGEARGKQYFDKFRQLMADIAAEEQGLLVTRRANSAEAVSFTYSAVAICLTLGLLVCLALAWLIGNGIANPIGQMTAVMCRLAKGDKTIEVTNTDRKDEIGAMAVAVQVFKDSMIENDRLQSEQAAADKQALEQEREREAQTGYCGAGRNRASRNRSRRAPEAGRSYRETDREFRASRDHYAGCRSRRRQARRRVPRKACRALPMRPASNPLPSRRRLRKQRPTFRRSQARPRSCQPRSRKSAGR